MKDASGGDLHVERTHEEAQCPIATVARAFASSI